MAETTVRCTPETAPQFLELVNAWPELKSLVRELQRQDLFPGLRAMTVHVAGDVRHEDAVGQLAAQLNAQQGGAA